MHKISGQIKSLLVRLRRDNWAQRKKEKEATRFNEDMYILRIEKKTRKTSIAFIECANVFGYFGVCYLAAHGKTSSAG